MFKTKGKFLFSGEYLVLEGAKAFAMPLQLGQNFSFTETSNTNILSWKSFEKNKLWFKGEFNLKSQTIIESNNPDVANRLLSIFKVIKQLNPSFYITISNGYAVESHLEFNQNWGLGTSSTLIAAISKWAGIDPYLLLEETFGGSGYDIACAFAEESLFYKKDNGKVIVEKVDYNPSFSDRINFVYLGQKSNSRTGMRYFRENAKWTQEDINQISACSEKWPTLNTADDLMTLINELETRMSKILNLSTAKDLHFPDFDGSIKSLGAWGGDFVLTISENYDKEYFIKKGYETVIPYNQLVYHNSKIVAS